MKIYPLDSALAYRQLIAKISSNDSSRLVKAIAQRYAGVFYEDAVLQSQLIWQEALSTVFDSSTLLSSDLKPLQVKVAILASNFGLDVTGKFDSADKMIDLFAETGGTPFKVATGLVNRNVQAKVFGPRESGDLALLHMKLMESDGIDISKLTSVKRPGHLHLQLQYADGDIIGLFPPRGELTVAERTEINQAMFEWFSSMPGGILSMGLAPLTGAEEGEHKAILAEAANYNIEGIYDTFEWDVENSPAQTMDSFAAGFSMITPNLKEFVLVLKAAGIIADSEYILDKLENQLAQNQFAEFKGLINELLKKKDLNFDNLLITCGKHGIALVNRSKKKLIFVHNPKLDKADIKNQTGCGDSVSAAIIETASSQNISLREHDVSSSIKLAEEGVFAGATTIGIDGSGIATIDQIMVTKERFGQLGYRTLNL